MEPITLTTERLVLRPHLPSDVDETYAACQDPAIARWIPVAVPYGRCDAEEYVTRAAPGCVRLVWRAGLGNTASRAVAEKAGFTFEGVQRAGMEHRGLLRDCWVASLLPADLGLPSPLPAEPLPYGAEPIRAETSRSGRT
ncbi:GNAT family N-acetyltransferase [Streptomyces sp. NPDC058157]|uniref:GNAT family N-acetyltransferase n=1 Tax=Streptomyces sp. NPDC058157 TaxID=3346360 RepID=UPI0036E5CA51